MVVHPWRLELGHARIVPVICCSTSVYRSGDGKIVRKSGEGVGFVFVYRLLLSNDDDGRLQLKAGGSDPALLLSHLS